MAYKLILKFKDSVISEIPLEQEETTIGRKPENSIHVDNLAVSGHHCRILKIGSKIILEDLGSTNGTLVNDKQVTKSILKHGDVVLVGKHTLTFISLDEGPVQAESEPEPENDMDKTMIISPQARSAMMKGEEKPAAMPLGALQVVSGPSAGKNFDLTASLTSIGKADNCRIKVKGLTVGKQAAIITRRPTGYHIAHLEGMSKPKVNGDSVSDQPRTLKDGDIIIIGDTKMEFYIK
ncbi:MAG: FHA domain-containing protein [Mariprofundaceae bacterium]